MQSDGGNRIPVTAKLIGIAIALPFWLATVLLWSRVDPVKPDGALALAIAYGAIILAFNGGIRFGVATGPFGGQRQSRDMLIAVLPVAAAASAMFLRPVVGLSLLLSGFLLQALWDVISCQSGHLPRWFADFRIMVTAMVVPALLAILGKVVHLLAA